MSCHSFIFFDRDPALASIREKELEAWKAEFIASLNTLPDGVTVAGYKTLGFKSNARFMLHLEAPEAESIQHCIESLVATRLGKHLKITYTLLGLTRPSQYRQGPKEEAEFIDGAMKYLIVYPFTKTTEWHLLPFAERKEMMKEHVMVAREHSQSINQLLLYSYGVDDHEFIVSYQAEDLLEFQTLVMDLRNTKGRRYTENDLPIFTCIYSPLTDLLETV